MKIYGIGTDIVKIKRIKNSFKKNKIFKNRIFSKNEIIFCEKNKNKFNCYAKRFAAKEAFSKSIGTGISKGLKFNEISVKNDILGKPKIIIKGKSLKIVLKMLNTKRFRTYLSLSDEDKYAIATILTVI